MLIRFFLIFNLSIFCIALKGTRKVDVKDCPQLLPRDPPQSIEDLRPDDISVVMAVGDSLLTGLGAKTFNLYENSSPTAGSSSSIGLIIQEHRGLSFAMGGDPHAASLANYLKQYNPRVVGASRGTHLVNLCHGKWCPPDELAYRPNLDQFNAALTGATSANLGLEMRYLTRRVIKDPSVNITGDWKLLTVVVGGNDLCQFSCEQPNESSSSNGQFRVGSADHFEAKVRLALQTARAKLPRTLVLLHQLPDPSQAHWFAHRHRRCLPNLPFLAMECPCAMGSSHDRWSLRAMTAEYNERILRIARDVNREARAESELAGKPLEWAVVVMPTLVDTSLKDDIPHHFISKLDCFHPSSTGLKAMAAGLWNNLWLTQSEKARHLTGDADPLLYCPTDEDRIRLE